MRTEETQRQETVLRTSQILAGGSGDALTVLFRQSGVRSILGSEGANSKITISNKGRGYTSAPGVDLFDSGGTARVKSP